MLCSMERFFKKCVSLFGFFLSTLLIGHFFVPGIAVGAMASEEEGVTLEEWQEVEVLQDQASEGVELDEVSDADEVEEVLTPEQKKQRRKDFWLDLVSSAFLTLAILSALFLFFLVVRGKMRKNQRANQPNTNFNPNPYDNPSPSKKNKKSFKAFQGQAHSLT